MTERFDEYAYVGYYPVLKKHQDKDHYPHPGDLVQAQAFEVGHPGVEEGVVNDAYIMVGVMEKYCYKNSYEKENGEEYCLVDWDKTTVAINQTITATLDHEMPPVKPDHLTILAKKRTRRLKV